MEPTISSQPQRTRDLFWPIYGAEHKIWLPMATMVGLILFNYTVARNLKDSLVVTATQSSEIIPYLKGALVLPASVIFFFVYSRLASLVGKRTLFYVIIAGFIVVYVLFAVVLYPNHEFLHPTRSADYLESVLPRGLKGLIDCYRVWAFALFYVTSELWGVAAASLLFWQFANDVINVADAKRFYPHFYLLANIFVTFSGLVVTKISRATSVLPEGVDYWGLAITRLTVVMTICGIAILIIYFYLDRYVFDDTYMATHAVRTYEKNEALKMTMLDGIRYVLKSKYLGLMAVLIICYGITANLLEITWKRQLVQLYSSGTEYAAFMGNLSTATGLGTIIAIFLGSVLLRKWGWLVSAMLTPVVVFTLGTFFFIAVMFPSLLNDFSTRFGWSPLFLAVMIGFVLEVLIKSIKYALFDPTKEIAYIPLDDEAKIRGKAAVDVVAGRFGKSSGGFFEISILAIVGLMSNAILYFSIVFVLFSIIWIFAVYFLNIRFQAAVAQKGSP